MSIINVGGLPRLSSDVLESLAASLESEAYSYLRHKKLFTLLSSLNLTIVLSQDDSNILTLTIDFDFSGSFSSNQLRFVQSNLFEYLSQFLRDELQCLKDR